MKKKHKTNHRPGWMLIRYGGLGDSLFITSAAKVLRDRGYKVTAIVPKHHAPLFKGLDIEVGEAVRRAAFPHGTTGVVKLVKSKDGHLVPVEALYEGFRNDDPRREWRVTDFTSVIEQNSTRPFIGKTLNSDFVNAYDLHLAWCGIDPTTVPDEDKRPQYRVSKQEREWAKNILAGLPRPIVLIQPGASSPARTYMRGRQLAQKIIDDGATVVYWNGQKWHFDGANLEIPQGMNGFRATGALVDAANLVISVDTFISHLAEAVGTKHLTLYSTVPSWTRSKYYQHEITVNAAGLLAEKNGQTQGCYCHVIQDGRCPLQEKELVASLDDYDKLALSALPPEVRAQNMITDNIKPPEGFHPPDLLPGGIVAMKEAALKKWNILRHAESRCIKAVDLFDYYKEWRQGHDS